MDKSLKHLSRLDLLELMIKLSEENEAELFLPDYYGDFSGKKVRIIPDTEADIKDVH